MGKQPLWWGKIFNAFGFGGKSRVPVANPIGRRHLRCEELESRTLLSICTGIGAGHQCRLGPE